MALYRGGRRLGTLSVSVTDANAFVAEVGRLSGHQVSVFRNDRRLASTIRNPGGSSEHEQEQVHEGK